MRDFFCHKVKGLTEAPKGRSMRTIYLFVFLVGHMGKITVFSFREGRKLSLFCPSLKPVLACGHSMGGQIHGSQRGFPLASLPGWKSSACMQMDSGRLEGPRCLWLIRQNTRWRNSNNTHVYAIFFSFFSSER